jgi:hypothetical protein
MLCLHFFPEAGMAKSKSPAAEFAISAAEVVGRAVGTVTGTVERLHEEHPHPIDEARDVIHEGQERVTAIADNVSERAAAAVATTKAVVKKARTAVRNTTRQGARIVKKARTAARKAAARVTKAKPKAKAKARPKKKAVARKVAKAKKSSKKSRTSRR